MKQVWCRKYSDEMNVKIDFVLKLRIVRGMELKLAANIPFRLSLDGEIVGYGPKRRAKGFARRQSLRSFNAMQGRLRN